MRHCPTSPRPSPPAGVIGRGPPARRCARRCRRLHDKRIRSKARRGFVAACQPFVDITPDVAKHASLRPSPDVLFWGPLALDFLYTTCLACGPPPFLQRPSIETPGGVTRIHSDEDHEPAHLHLALLCGLVDRIAFAPSNHACTYFMYNPTASREGLPYVFIGPVSDPPSFNFFFFFNFF